MNQPQDILSMGQHFDHLNYQGSSQGQQIFLGQADTDKPDFYGHDEDEHGHNMTSPRGSANSMIANELNEGAQLLPQSVSKSPQVLLQRTQKSFDFSENKIANIHPDPLHQNLVNNGNDLVRLQLEKKTASTPKVSNKPPVVIEPRPVTHQVERQIKYLGLVIEKDEEYQIQEDDLQIMRYQKQNGCISRFSAKELERYENEDPDNVKRQYYPIRDRYIKIVKNSRKLSIESFEKRGRKDLK